MRRLRRPLVRIYLLWVYRSGAFARPLQALRYLIAGKELTNFTYELGNLDELVSVLARALEVDPVRVQGWLDEVASDDELLGSLRTALQAHPDRGDEPLFGRRLGWYAIVRALQPRVAVETGTHDGLGTALLLRALQRNAAEGSPGTLLTFDVDPDSGWLVPAELRSGLETVLGDVRRTLPEALAGRRIGFFVHDSLHEYGHERWEFELALEHADDRLALVSDNARDSSSLADVAGERGLDYHQFDERPVRHFYPGAALGVAIYDARRASET